MGRSDLRGEAQFRKLLEWCLCAKFLLTDRIWLHSPKFGRPKQGQTIFVPPFHIYFLNPECVRFPGYLPRKMFKYGAIYETFPFSTDFLVCTPKKKYRARVPTILMLPTFPIASLNHYTSKGGPKSRPGVIGIAFSTLKSQPIQKVVHDFRCFLDKISFPSQMVNICL